VTFTITPAATTTVLNASATTLNGGQSETLTALISSVAGTPDGGTVTFLDGTTSLGTATVNNGVATLTTTALTAGTHVLSANYSGDGANFAGSTNVFGPESVVSTVAGNGSQGANGIGGLATSAQLNDPLNVAIDAAGDLFIVDANNNRIEEVDAKTHLIRIVAGTGTAGYNGDGITATAAELSDPESIAIDSAGDLFITDSANYRVREVSASTGLISTVAGTGVAGYNGDGISPTTAELNFPDRIAVDANGDLFIADSDNFRVREVNATTHLIATVAGTGIRGYNGDGIAATSAELGNVTGIAIDAAGDLFISDKQNNRVLEVNAETGLISSVAGTGTRGDNGNGIAATAAELSRPENVAVDADGDLFIADSGNNQIREVNATTGLISTVVGTGISGFNGDGLTNTLTQIADPWSVAVDSAGNLFVADTGNNRIREITSGTVTVNVNQASIVTTSISISPPQTINFGTPSTTISGQLSAQGSASVPVGESVQVSFDGQTQAATLDASGNFSVTFATSSLDAGIYPIQVTYAGDAEFSAANATSSLEIAAVAQIAVSAGNSSVSNATGIVDFGSTPLGTRLTQVITVTNSGDAPLIVQPVGVSAEFSVVSGTNFTANESIAPGASASFTIQLKAKLAGTLSGVVTIDSNDPSLSSFTFNLTATVTHNAPYAIALANNTIADNMPAGSTVGQLATYDIDSQFGPQTFTYSLASGGDNAAFAISGNQLVTTGILDASAQKYYHIQVTSTEDSSGLSYATELTVVVLPMVNHAPYYISLTSNTISDAQPVGTAVGTVFTYDVDSTYRSETYAYSLGSGGDNPAFAIVGNQLQTAANLDAGIQQYYHIQITSTEVSSGLSYTTTMTVIVTPSLTHAPYAITLTKTSIQDSSPIGSTVGTLVSYDVDSNVRSVSYNYSLGAGGDNSAFTIVGNQLQTAVNLDATVQQYYHIQVTSTEVGTTNSFTTDLTVIVKPATIKMHAPYAVTLTANSISDGSAIGTIVGRLDSYDVDSNISPQTFTYALGIGGDNSAFAISGNNLVTNQLLDATLQQYYHIQVTSTEDSSGKSNVFDLTVIVTPSLANAHAPYSIALTNNTVSDNSSPGATVGTLVSYDVDSNVRSVAFTYALGSGGDNSAFTIVGNQLQTAVNLDATVQEFYHIQVTSTEVGTQASYTQTLTVVVLPVTNHQPYAIVLTNNTISNGAASGTTVGTLFTYDADSNFRPETFTYSLGNGGDNSAFTFVNGNVLQTTIPMNLAVKKYYHVQLTSTEDSSGLAFTTTLTVIVQPTPEVVIVPVDGESVNPSVDPSANLFDSND
jgi:sugar lactone lactonase YvrE